jgi:hypothetical protein
MRLRSRRSLVETAIDLRRLTRFVEPSGSILDGMDWVAVLVMDLGPVEYVLYAVLDVPQ